MPFIIEDGKGTGLSAAVNSENRLLTRAITSTTLEHAASVGNTYAIDTGIINLTTGTESGILYFKNTNPNLSVEVHSFIFCFGKSNTTGDTLIKSYSNPTGGTLITNGTTIVPNNRNLGVSTPAIGNTIGGAEGKTITGGSTIANFILQCPSVIEVSSSIIIPNGYSVAASITPPSGNTSMNISVFVRLLYFEEDNL